MRNFVLLAIAVSALLAHSPARAWEVDEDEAVKVSIQDLTPAQMNVGMAEVQVREAALRPLLNDRGALKDALKAKPGTAVIGPGKKLYLIDGHHFAKAVSDLGVDRFYVKITHDWSNLSENAFWARMQKWKYVYLGNGHGGMISPSELPRKISQLGDDPYRSLAWMVRKAEGYEKSVIPFQEFRWADFYRTRIPLDPKDPQALKKAVPQAVKLAESDEARKLRLPGRWTDAAGGPCDAIPVVGRIVDYFR